MRQTVGSGSDLLGPAVTVAHRLLKNTVYPDAGVIQGRIVRLGEPAQEGVPT